MKGKNVLKKRNHRLACMAAVIVALFASTGVLAADEMLDPYFGAQGIVLTTFGGISDTSNHITIQTDGKIIISGLHKASTPFVTRYDNNGSLDTTFGTNGTLTPQIGTFAGTKVAIQADGKLLIAGTDQGGFAIARYNASGTDIDPTFGVNGLATFSADSWNIRYSLADIVVQPDQKIVTVGTQEIGNFTNFVIVRFNTDGTPDTTFITNGFLIMDKTDFPNNRFNSANAIALQPDGKIIVSGHMLDDDANDQITLTRLASDGFPDKDNFGSNGKGTVITPLNYFKHSNSAILIQPDGKIVIAGILDDYDHETRDVALARFNSDGSLDSTFGPSGIVTTDFGSNETCADITLQPNGKIILAGKISSPESADILLVRYNNDGTLDQTFGTAGMLTKDFGNTPDSGNGLALQPDGLLLVAGSTNGNAVVARYILDVSTHPPVTLTLQSKPAQDGWILEASETSNSGGSLDRLATTFLVGDDAKDRQYRSILSFNTGAIPDPAIILSARLEIKRQAVVGSNPFDTHGQLLLDIRSGTFSNNLSMQLIDFTAAVTQGARRERIPPSNAEWYSVRFKNSTLTYINKYGYTQFRLRFNLDDNDDMNADYIKFFSGNSTDTNAPKLTITYFVP
jgi:uncharacterized delta-60 repeat protein